MHYDNKGFFFPSNRIVYFMILVLYYTNKTKKKSLYVRIIVMKKKDENNIFELCFDILIHPFQWVFMKYFTNFGKCIFFCKYLLPIHTCISQ